MRAGRGFGVILHAENRQFAMAHAFDRAVIQIDMRHFDLGRERIRIDRKSVILRRDRHSSGFQIFNRLVAAAMSEFQFVRFAAEG